MPEPRTSSGYPADLAIEIDNALQRWEDQGADDAEYQLCAENDWHYSEFVALVLDRGILRRDADLVIVPRAALVSVMDSLAEWANRRGELHDGLTVLLPYLTDSTEQGANPDPEPRDIGPK